MKSMDKSVALVTGAGRGVGRHIAVGLARRGASVAAQDISPVNLDHTLQLIEAAGSRGLELVGDTSKKMQVQGMIEAAREALGEIDMLINQGTVAPRTDLLTIDEWDWDRTLGVNLKGYFLTIQSLGRLMCDRRRGLIANVIIPPTRYERTSYYPAYEVSAAALRALTREAAREFGPDNVTVFAVKPAGGAAAEDRMTWWQREPEMMAEAIVNLCQKPVQINPGTLFVVEPDGSSHAAGRTAEKTN